MPAVRIGKNSVIGPGVVLYQDADDNSAVFVRQNLEINNSKQTGVTANPSITFEICLKNRSMRKAPIVILHGWNLNRDIYRRVK